MAAGAFSSHWGLQRMLWDQKHPILLNNSAVSRDFLALLGSVCSIYICYLVYGVFQERIFKNHRGVEQEVFSYTLFLVLLQCISNSIVAQICIWYSRSPPSKVPWWKFAQISSCFIGAMVCSHSSLRFVNYPIQVLGKSCKMVPVMISGTLLHGKRYSWQQYVSVFAISLGICVFMVFRPSVLSDDSIVRWEGIALIIASLALDGYTGPSQEALIHQYKPSTHQLMLGTNIFAIVIAFVLSLSLGVFFPAIEYCSRHPEILLDIGLFCLTSALGQNFIFMTLVRFDALVLTIVTTTRKFFSILASVVYFQHVVNEEQWFGVVLVFGGLFFNIYFKYTHKPKSRTE